MVTTVYFSAHTISPWATSFRVPPRPHSLVSFITSPENKQVDRQWLLCFSERRVAEGDCVCIKCDVNFGQIFENVSLIIEHFRHLLAKQACKVVSGKMIIWRDCRPRKNKLTPKTNSQNMSKPSVGVSVLQVPVFHSVSRLCSSNA